MAALLGTALLGAFAGSSASGIGPGRAIAKGIAEEIPILGTQIKKKRAEKLAKEQDEKQKGIEAEAATRLEQEESTAASQAAGKKARKRQKAKSATAQGRRGTLLTGPLGLVGEPETSGKTLLGT